MTRQTFSITFNSCIQHTIFRKTTSIILFSIMNSDWMLCLMSDKQSKQSRVVVSRRKRWKRKREKSISEMIWSQRAGAVTKTNHRQHWQGKMDFGIHWIQPTNISFSQPHSWKSGIRHPLILLLLLFWTFQTKRHEEDGFTELLVRESPSKQKPVFMLAISSTGWLFCTAPRSRIQNILRWYENVDSTKTSAKFPFTISWGKTKLRFLRTSPTTLTISRPSA